MPAIVRRAPKGYRRVRNGRIKRGDLCVARALPKGRWKRCGLWKDGFLVEEHWSAFVARRVRCPRSR